jgi:hypothetical protein
VTDGSWPPADWARQARSYRGSFLHTSRFVTRVYEAAHRTVQRSLVSKVEDHAVLLLNIMKPAKLVNR